MWVVIPVVSALLLAGLGYLLQLYILHTREPYRETDCQRYVDTEVPDLAVRRSAVWRRK